MSYFKMLLFSFLFLSQTQAIKSDESYHLSEDAIEKLANEYNLSQESINQVKLLQKISSEEEKKINELQKKYLLELSKIAMISGGSAIATYYVLAFLLSYKIENSDLINQLSGITACALSYIISHKLYENML